MSTIDDALGGLPDGDKKLEKTVSENTPDSLVIRAREIMGPVLVDYFRGNLGGQRADNIIISNQFIPVIEKMGLDIFTIIPNQSIDGDRVLISDLNVLDDNDTKDMLKIVLGEYSLETDIVNLVHGGGIGKLVDNLVEFRAFKRELLDNYDNNFLRATLNPYIIVMGMKPENRAFATLSVKNAEEKGTLEFIDVNDTLSITLNKSFIAETLSKMSPLTINYLEVAKGFGIKSILYIMNDFDKAAREYIDVWGVR